MADGKQPMNYESYILPHQLPEVRPREHGDGPDEQFFIRTHQAFEIWFAQALAELERHLANLGASEQPNDARSEQTGARPSPPNPSERELDSLRKYQTDWESKRDAN